MIVITVLFFSVVAFAGDLFQNGYDAGYNDGFKAIQYFVSPTLGQTGKWISGYKKGIFEGEIDRNSLEVAEDKFSTFDKKLTQIVDLFKAVNFSNDENDHNQYMADSENMFERIRMNIENDDIDAGIEKGVLLEKYAEYATNMDSYDRTSFTPLNKNLVEYLNFRLMVVTEKGTKLEMKYYGDLLKKVVNLISK